MARRRRSSKSGGQGCGIVALVVMLGLVVRAFQAAPVVSVVVLVVIILGTSLGVLVARNQKSAATAAAKTAEERREETERLAVLHQVQRDLENKQQDSRDDVRFIVNRKWRVTPMWLIEGRAEDAKRYSLAGLTAVYKDGIFVIAGRGVEVAERVDHTKSGQSLSEMAARITELARAAEEAGPPTLSRHCEPLCRCPAGHEGFHAMASTHDPGFVLRTCIDDGCRQTWRERA